MTWTQPDVLMDQCSSYFANKHSIKSETRGFLEDENDSADEQLGTASSDTRLTTPLARLQVSGLGGDDVVELMPMTELVVGRDPSQSQAYIATHAARIFQEYFTINSREVSAAHFRIYSILFDGDSDEFTPLIYCEDLSSTNGTWLVDENGARELVGNRKSEKHVTLLTPGQTVAILPHWKFRLEQETVPLGQSWTDIQSREMEMFSDTFAISGRALGSGGYGKVHLAHHNKHQLACKVVSFERLWDEICADFGRRGRMDKIAEMHRKFIEVRTRTLEEIQLWRKLDHPNIAAVIKVFRSPHNLYTFTEIAYGGDLFSYQQAHGGTLCYAETLVVSRQIAKALEYLHDRGIAHRDVKPENILLTRNDIGHRVLLTDFGHAIAFEAGSKVRRMKSCVGTVDFIAPEIKANEDHYTTAVDMWSFGMTIGVLLIGEVLCAREERQTNTQRELAYGPLRIFNYPRPEVKDLVDSLLTGDPLRRPSAKAVLQHAWYCGTASIREALNACEDRAWCAWQRANLTRQSRPLVEDIEDFMPGATQVIPGVISQTIKTTAHAPNHGSLVPRDPNSNTSTLNDRATQSRPYALESPEISEMPFSCEEPSRDDIKSFQITSNIDNDASSYGYVDDDAAIATVEKVEDLSYATDRWYQGCSHVKLESDQRLSPMDFTEEDDTINVEKRNFEHTSINSDVVQL